jgi:hypothetical protein
LTLFAEYVDTFIPSQTTKQTTFHLPLEQHIHSKSQLDNHILQPLWITLTQILEQCLSMPTSEENPLLLKTVIACETIIAWDFGIEEGTFRRVSFGPVNIVNAESDDIDEEKQPIWPGSWGTVINEFVVDLFFKVLPFLYPSFGPCYHNVVPVCIQLIFCGERVGLRLDAKCLEFNRK